MPAGHRRDQRHATVTTGDRPPAVAARKDVMTTTSILRDHPALTPVEFGPHTLSNRLAVAPMTRVSATPDGTPTAEMAEYYAAFAEGGFGLVITEGVHPDDAA